MLTADLLPTSSENKLTLKRNIGAEISKILGKYEAELYQDRYLPEYQKTQREISRREKEEAEDRRRRDQSALDRVAALSGEDSSEG